MDTADRNYIESLIAAAIRATVTARIMAESFELDDAAEKLTWALDFQRIAAAKVTTGTNEDGTFGPSHITTEGRELREPPQG